MRDEVDMRHSCLRQPRLPGDAKGVNSDISDFEENPVIFRTLAKLLRLPYPFGPKKCCFGNFERQTFFFKKNQVDPRGFVL